MSSPREKTAVCKRAAEVDQNEEDPSDKKIRRLSFSFLINAIKMGNVNKVQEFLKQNEEFKEENKKMTPLHYAAEGNNLQIVELMLKNGYGRVNSRNRSDKTPLHLALKNKRASIIKYLIDNGSKNCLSKIDSDNEIRSCFLNDRLDILKCLLKKKELIQDSMIYYSVTENRYEILKYLLQCGDKVNKTPQHHFFLHKAVEIGDWKILQLFINANFDLISGRNLQKRTPLYYAVRECHFEIMKFLLEKGAKNTLNYEECCDLLKCSINTGRLDILQYLGPNDYISHDILYHTASIGNLEILEYLLKCGVEINSDTTNTALHAAVEFNNIKIVKYLIENGHHFHTIRNSDGKTAVDLAILGVKLEIIDYFVNCRSMRIINERNLCEAVKMGHLNLLKYLITNGCGEINKEIMGIGTLLHCSASEGQLEIVKYLLANGAQVNHLSKENKTPLVSAITAGQTKIVEELLKHGAVNKKHKIPAESVKDEILLLLLRAGHKMKNYFGRRKPLLIAAELGYSKFLKEFIKSGIDVNSQTIRKQSALDLAIVNEHYESVRVLLKAGANPKGYGKMKPTPLECAIENNKFHIVKEILDRLPKEDLEEAVLHSLDLAVMEKKSITFVNILLDYDFNNKYKPIIETLDCESKIFISLVDHIQRLETLVDFQKLLLKKICRGLFHVNSEVRSALISRIALLKSLPENANNFGEMIHARFIEKFKFRDWYKKCENEIDLMKRTKVLPKVSEMTYYDFLAKPLYKLEKCVSNAKLMKNFECSNGFKTFQKFFYKRAKRIRIRCKFIDSCKKSLYYMVYDKLKIHLPSEIVDKVCEYLTALEVRRLAESYPM
ncbi:ankyrin-3-like [Leptopilina heterotoma]|uniref:ankyrin-3-like n=1 Tax=Leptopilina heterotoma TaxID=63436 RepID=UPI001CA88512|nr:ankyrin-3-like [Leptopilina heterotoma]